MASVGLFIAGCGASKTKATSSESAPTQESTPSRSSSSAAGASSSAAARQAAADKWLTDMQQPIQAVNQLLAETDADVADYLAGKVTAASLKDLAGIGIKFYATNSVAMSGLVVPKAADLSDVPKKMSQALDKFDTSVGALLGFDSTPAQNMLLYTDNRTAGLTIWNAAITKAYAAAGRPSPPVYPA